jgi:hypothetical protein
MMIFLCTGMTLMGFTWIQTFLSELFLYSVRYSGASLTFNLAGIIGAALPYDRYLVQRITV